ncbi:signal peptidase I [Candidatus Kaiserbacteria bacterium]|nr:signal peptidase I [Candidatus Kaiserbacteria bacterium]
MFPNKATDTTNQESLVIESETSPQLTKEEHPLSEIIRFALLAIIIVVPIRFFVAQPFIVSGASMDDTFQHNQYLIVDQLTYHFDTPERGDVVIFRYPKDLSKFFIKRVIGVPGDTITIEGQTVTITNKEHPDGTVLDEPYVHAMDTPSYVSETLGDGEYFVMGDNRDHSSDSRMWGILQEDKIVGRALLRLFPFSTAGLFPGKYDAEGALNTADISS